MPRALYRSVTCNVLMFDPSAQRLSTIREAWGHADVLKLQEASGDAANIRKLRGAKWYRPDSAVGSLNPIIWRDSEFKLIDKGTKTFYVGGKGWGPSRGIVWVVLEHKDSRKRVIEANTHQINKAYNGPQIAGRKNVWNDVQQGCSDELQRLRDKYPGTPIVMSGDFNRSGDFGFPGFPNLDLVSIAGSGIDRFYDFGGIEAKSHLKFRTMSDHASIMVNFEITAAATQSGSGAPLTPTTTPKPAPKPTTSPSGNTSTPPTTPNPSIPGELDLRRRATWRAKPRWRFFAVRMDGTGGSGEIIHPQLPLQDPEIEDMLTGHNSLRGKISPEYGSLIADDGRLLLEEWGSAIFAEESGNIHGGGIVTHSGFDRADWSIECTGLTGYAKDLPYASATFFVEEDPLNIFRHIWNHIQAQPGGNVGLEVDNLYTGLQIGTVLEQVEFDTQSGPISFEAGPYKLAWYQDHDLDEKLGGLAADIGFDWHEEHYWDGDTLRHRLRLGYPIIGVRRTDLRFVIGENVAVVPSVDRDGDEYADEIWTLGSGEGSAMMRGIARRDIAKLRRVAVIADPSIRTQSGVNARSDRELQWRNNLDNITELVVRDHPHADIGSISVGDEIQIQGATGWVDLDAWYRVIGRKIAPYSPEKQVLTVTRSDRIAS